MSSLPMDGDLQAAESASRLRTVIGGLLSATQVDRLLSLWRECQASQVRCSVPGFVDKVASELHLDEEVAGKLRIKLFAEVLANRPATQRAAVGRPLQGPPPAAAARPAQDPASVVFVALIGQLDTLVRNRHDARWAPLRAALLRKFGERPVARFDTGPLLRSEQTPAQLAAPVVDESARQDLVHVYYLALCEVLGPMPADRLLSDAVKLVEQLPAAARYAPRRLL